MEIVEHFKEVQ